LEDFRIKISVLWLFWTVSFLVSLVSALFEPGAMARITEGEMGGFKVTPELILLTTIMILVPLIMAFLSLTLKDSINRWANVVLGVVYTGICLFDWLGSPVQPAYAILMVISRIMASALIVSYAWRSKQSMTLARI
jgi:hypothetical protein